MAVTDKRGGAAQRGDAILRRVGKGARGVEVGVFRGVLSGYLLRHGVSRLFMVDNWLPAGQQPERYRDTRDYCSGLSVEEASANRAFAEGVAARSAGRATIIARPSLKAASLINDRSMDFVFIDADHSYAGVKADLAAWVPKVRPGGWICGHDYGNAMPEYDFSGVDRAVDEWASLWGVPVETDDNFTWFCRL
jgi:predicted O-methyltransferase YrrM